jgi:hypothetical protein
LPAKLGFRRIGFDSFTLDIGEQGFVQLLDEMIERIAVVRKSGNDVFGPGEAGLIESTVEGFFPDPL